MAKTVRTDTILITPMEAPASGGISADEMLQPGPDPLSEGEAGEETAPRETETAVAENLPVPDVLYDAGLLPPPVARMRAQLRDAALSGEVERLRMVFEANEVPPTLSLTEIGDPIEFLKESSGDEHGLEILAILADTLDAGFIHTDVGTAQEMYIWPYFARYPFSELSKEQKVEMYRIVTAADFAEMEAFGTWLFYRVGIGKDGTLHYFVAGE